MRKRYVPLDNSSASSRLALPLITWEAPAYHPGWNQRSEADPGALWPQLKAGWIQEGNLKLDL